VTKYIVTRANLLGFGVLVVLLLLVGIATWDRLNAARSARQWWQHSYSVIGAIKDLDLSIHDAESGQRGFLLTGNEDYLKPYNAALGRVTLLESALNQLTADNPAEQARLAALGPLVQRKLEEMSQTIVIRRDDGASAALRIVQTNLGRDLMVEIESTIAGMANEEHSLLAKRLAVLDERALLIRWLFFGGTALAILALIYAAWLLNQAWSRSYRAESEERLAAQRLRVSLDSLSQGVGVFDVERHLTNWNECFQVLLDLPEPMLRPGTRYTDIAGHAAEDGMILETEDQLRHGRHGLGEATVYEGMRAGGHTLELRRTAMPDGGFVITVTDMTKRAQAESVMREAQKMQAIGQLTGGIAHDFNNLLTVIMGNLEVVSSRLGTDPALQLRIERAAWAAERGATLTAQLLSFARKQPLAPAPLDLTATVPAMVPLLRRTLGEHIDVRYVETAGLWPAMADAAQLESAVLNLALNARDAMPGGGRLTIELGNRVLDEDYARRHAEVDAGDYAMLAVSDTGHGMTAEVARRVFEPFFTTKPDGKGTGLGLAMVFGFVKQSGGHVKIYSEPGQGTTVRIYLPRAHNAAFEAVERSGPPIALPRGSATILVVEDEPAVREVAVAILNDLGYRVLEAADGEEGLRVFAAQADSIALVLSDVVLPGELRGREMAGRITAMRPGVKVLFMSGYTENSIVHHGRLDEGVQLIGKPFKREQLARRVADVLARTG
jgi:signal transduction histidine kinase/CheY-like chemotaxis protein